MTPGLASQERQLSGTLGIIHSPAPGLGQHTSEILAQLGLGQDALDELRQQGGRLSMPAGFRCTVLFVPALSARLTGR